MREIGCVGIKDVCCVDIGIFYILLWGKWCIMMKWLRLVIDYKGCDGWVNGSGGNKGGWLVLWWFIMGLIE